VNSHILPSTLREMRILVRSPRLWQTFGAVVLLFAITGPYETAERLNFLPRLAYWLVLHAGAWSFALSSAVLADVVLKDRIGSMFVRMLIGAVVASLPIGLVIGTLEWSWFDVPLTARGYLSGLIVTLPLSAIFCVISYMAMSGGRNLDAPDDEGLSAVPISAVPPATERETIPLLERLKVENRGRLQHISVEDHYSRIRTSRGSELILMRFADAIRETGTADGLRVHRSHWVARDFVAAFRSANGRSSLLLNDGTVVPVSRTYADEARARLAPVHNDKSLPKTL
jgi:DNA-binding LytR/AlgR family response regulator